MNPYLRTWIAVLLLAWLPLQAAVLAYPFAARRVLQIERFEADYLASLREQTKLGCFTLLPRVPELAVLGDSHAYAALDFRKLQELSKRRVGVCAMGGLYADELPVLLDLAADAGARTVVVTLSPRMFWKGKNAEAQRAAHLSLIDQARSDTLGFWRRALLRLARGASPWPIASDADDLAVTRGQERLDAIDPAAVHAKLEAARGGALTATWRGRIETALRDGTLSAETVAEELCTRARERKLTLLVAPLPESPLLEAMYPASLQASYLDAISRLGRCAAVAELAARAAVDDRCFLARGLDAAYPWDAWRADATGDVGVERLFDLDHMNGVCARRVSAAVAESLPPR